MNIDYERELGRALHAMFPDRRERERVMGKMSRYGKEPYQREAPRVMLSILRLTHEAPDKLDYYLDEACKDYRDILCWAEYRHTSRRWGFNRTDPDQYRKLREKEEREFRAWLTSLGPACS